MQAYMQSYMHMAHVDARIDIHAVICFDRVVDSIFIHVYCIYAYEHRYIYTRAYTHICIHTIRMYCFACNYIVYAVENFGCDSSAWRALALEF